MRQFQPNELPDGVHVHHLLGWQLYAHYLRTLCKDLHADMDGMQEEIDRLRASQASRSVSDQETQAPEPIQCVNCKRHGHFIEDCIATGGGREGQTWVNRKKAYRLSDGSLDFKYK